MTPRELEEYSALRATIRQRGTARHWMIVAGISAWAALALAVAALSAVPVETLIPLVVLVATFETVLALHTGIERVGRYIQVFYESEPGTAQWEHMAMAFGRTFGSGGVDALFSQVFWLATVFNLVPAMISEPLPVEWAVVGSVHALFAWRVWTARRQAAGQRMRDLEHFAKLKADSSSALHAP